MAMACLIRPMSEIADGKRVIVKEVSGGKGFVTRMAALGVLPGTEIEMVRNTGRGPIIIKVKGSFLALGRGEAARVLVQEENGARVP